LLIVDCNTEGLGVGEDGNVVDNKSISFEEIGFSFCFSCDIEDDDNN
jgi:hypothetical protein